MNKRLVMLRTLFVSGAMFALAGCFEAGPDYYAGYPDYYYSRSYYGGPEYYVGPEYNVYPEYGYYQPQPWYRRWWGGGNARAENRENEEAESRNFAEHRHAQAPRVEREAPRAEVNRGEARREGTPRAENNRAAASRDERHGSERRTGRD